MPTKLDYLSENARDELAQLALNMSGNEKTRENFLGLVKQVAPETVIPELQTRQRIEAALEPERKRVEKLENELRDERLNRSLTEKKSAVKNQFGFSDDDLGKMEKMMTDGKLPGQYEWAAPLYAQQARPAEPTNYGSSGYGPAELPSADGLMENEHRWSLQTAHKFIDESLAQSRGKSF